MTEQRCAVYNRIKGSDELAFMTFVSDDYARKALARGELEQNEEGTLVVVPQPMNEMSPAEKRAYVLAKERKARSNR